MKNDGWLGGLFSKRPVLFTALVTLLVAFSFQGTRGLFESTEGRYAECARQSMAANSLDEPLLNGEHHWTKPPLTYYATAAGMAVLGENAWGARIGLSIAFSLTVLLVWVAAKDVWGSSAAPFCALVYALSPFTVGAANALSTDTYLVLFEAAAVAFFWRALQTKKGYYILLMWAAFGAAFFTKGPVCLLPLLAMVAVKVYLRRRGEKTPWLLNPLGLILFTAVGLSWYAFKIMKYPELFDYWFFKETIARNVSGEFNRNGQWYKPPEVYGPPLLLGALPWSLLVLAKYHRIPWPKGQWRRITSWENPVQWLYITMAVLLPLAVLCLATSRLALYALPLSLPISLAVGKGLHFLYVNKSLSSRAIVVSAMAMTSLFVAGKGVSGYVDSPNDMSWLAIDVKPCLDKYPDYQLHVLKQQPLYGLQFYLKKGPIEMVELEEAQDVLKAAKETGKTQLVLVRTRTLKKIAESMDSRVYKVEPLNNNWAMIVIGSPPETM